jgi:predicted RNase H-like HicB family nuclease
MRYQVILFPGEDGFVVADCPSLPGCMSQGRTRAEALANIQEAMELWLEAEGEKGGQVPEPICVEIEEVDVKVAA